MGAQSIEVARVALVFVVAEKNAPVDNLTTQQVIDIYSRKMREWRPGLPIRLVRRPLAESDNFILKIVGYIPSHHVRRFVYRLEGMKIGQGSSIHMGAVFYKAKNVKIGKDTIIGEKQFGFSRPVVLIPSFAHLSEALFLEDPSFKSVVVLNKIAGRLGIFD